MDTKKDVMFLENTSKPRVFKWLFASVLLCALLVCAWTVAAGAEEFPHEHDYELYVDWSEDTTEEPTVTNARLVCWLQDCTDTVYIPDEDVTVLEWGSVSDATCTQPEMWHYMAQVDFEGRRYDTTSEIVYPSGDPLGHNYTVSPEDFIISRNEQTATATAVCWRCDEYTEGHTTTVTATVTGSDKVDDGDCQNRSVWEYTLSYELNGDSDCKGWILADGDYGDHFFTEIATQGRQAIRECSICGKLEGIEALSAVSAQLTGTKPAPASRVMVRYGTLASGEKVLAIALVDSNGNTVTTNAVCEVSISLAELNALLGEDAGDAFAYTLYPHKGGAKERIPMQYAIENGRLRLNVSFKTSGLYVLTVD